MEQQENNFKQDNFKSSNNAQENQLFRQTEKKLNIIRRKIKTNIQQSTYVSLGGLISPQGETRASSSHHFEREKKWSQSIIPLTCKMLNKAIQNVNIRLEIEGQPIELVELVGHVCNVNYGKVFTRTGDQNYMAIEICDLTDISQIIVYQPQNDPENLVEYLKRTENWQYNPEKMLMGVYIKVLIKPKYAVTESKWKNNCNAIKIVSNANELTKHNLDVIKAYLERKDGFIKKIRSPLSNNPIYQKARQREIEQKEQKIESSNIMALEKNGCQQYQNNLE